MALKAAPSAVLGFFIAFFPKCPVCWGIYMGIFGGWELVNVPHLGWLYSGLFILLSIHLVTLLRNAPRIGDLPFALSLAGATVILCSRFLSIGGLWVALTGMALVIFGSILRGSRVMRGAK